MIGIIKRDRKLHHVLTWTIYRQMVGRILVEMFRSAANTGTKLVVSEILQSIQPIIEDSGKSRTTVVIKSV